MRRAVHRWRYSCEDCGEDHILYTGGNKRRYADCFRCKKWTCMSRQGSA